MKSRNGWLFPLMVLAAGSVTVFGCIGIAAITGYLPLAKASAFPMGVTPAIVETLEAMAPSLNKQLNTDQTVVVVNTGAQALGEVAVEADRGKSAGPEPLKAGLAGKKPSRQ
jgi:hypothetical protein